MYLALSKNLSGITAQGGWRTLFFLFKETFTAPWVKKSMPLTLNQAVNVWQLLSSCASFRKAGSEGEAGGLVATQMKGHSMSFTCIRLQQMGRSCYRCSARTGPKPDWTSALPRHQKNPRTSHAFSVPDCSCFRFELPPQCWKSSAYQKSHNIV